MIDSCFRKPYQTLCVDPIIRMAVKRKINPITITLVALAAGIAIAPALACGYIYTAIVLGLLSGYCDTLDGSLARETGRTSPLGAVIDIVADRIVEFSIILGLCLVAPQERGLLCLIMCGSVLLCITTFLVVGIFTPNNSEKGFHYSPGLMERSEAFLFFAAMILFPAAFTYLAILFSVLVFTTAAFRMRDFAKI